MQSVLPTSPGLGFMRMIALRNCVCRKPTGLLPYIGKFLVNSLQLSVLLGIRNIFVNITDKHINMMYTLVVKIQQD